jgi:hypothetical protein
MRLWMSKDDTQNSVADRLHRIQFFQNSWKKCIEFRKHELCPGRLAFLAQVL